MERVLLKHLLSDSKEEVLGEHGDVGGKETSIFQLLNWKCFNIVRDLEVITVYYTQEDLRNLQMILNFDASR